MEHTADIMSSHDGLEGEIITKTKERFLREIPNIGLDDKDWKRLAFACELVAGDSVAEIGVGHGVIINALADTGRFSQVTGFDIRTHSQALLHEKVSYLQGSIIDTEFNVLQHDTVICMEVIEHLEQEHNEVMLENLRKITGRRLIMTVPYNEQEPLWWHDKPGGHRQSFSLEKLGTLFPNAIATILPRYGMDWIFIIEDHRAYANSFQIVPKADLKKRLGIY